MFAHATSHRGKLRLQRWRSGLMCMPRSKCAADRHAAAAGMQQQNCSVDCHACSSQPGKLHVTCSPCMHQSNCQVDWGAYSTCMQQSIFRVDRSSYIVMPPSMGMHFPVICDVSGQAWGGFGGAV